MISWVTLRWPKGWFEIITSEKTTTIDALKEGINKQKSEHQRQKSKLKRERVNIWPEHFEKMTSYLNGRDTTFYGNSFAKNY